LTFPGTIDEVRILNTAQSAGWINTSYLNQKNPATFYSVGSEESKVITKTYLIGLNKYWNLVSLPFNETKAKTSIRVRNNTIEYSWSEAVGHDIVLDYIYGWNQTIGNYEIGSSLAPERGYWIWAYYNCSLIITTGALLDARMSVLQPRWNMMGLPYNASVAKQNLIVRYNNIDYNWTQATTGGDPIILGFIYDWNRNDQMYTLSDTYGPGSGYWMYAYKNCLLKKGG
jgi:hypothetical protein